MGDKGPSLSPWLSDNVRYHAASCPREGRRVASDLHAEEDPDRQLKSVAIADWLGNAKEHKTHGRPIMIEQARDKGLIVERLEDDQELQERVLSVFHAAMVTFQVTQCVKSSRTTMAKVYTRRFRLPPSRFGRRTGWLTTACSGRRSAPSAACQALAHFGEMIETESLYFVQLVISGAPGSHPTVG